MNEEALRNQQMGNLPNQFSLGSPQFPMAMDPNFFMAQNYAQMYYGKMM